MKVVEVNFISSKYWLFKLQDASGVEYFILNSKSYAESGMSSPVTRVMLDSFDVGSSINASFEEVKGVNVVVAISS